LLEKGGLYRTLYSRELISESSQGEEAV
jgi:hypothetical protein